MLRGRTPGAMQSSAVRINTFIITNVTIVEVAEKTQLVMTLQALTRYATHAQSKQAARVWCGHVRVLVIQYAAGETANAVEKHAAMAASAEGFGEQLKRRV